MLEESPGLAIDSSTKILWDDKYARTSIRLIKEALDFEHSANLLKKGLQESTDKIMKEMSLMVKLIIIVLIDNTLVELQGKEKLVGDILSISDFPQDEQYIKNLDAVIDGYANDEIRKNIIEKISEFYNTEGKSKPEIDSDILSRKIRNLHARKTIL
jgi:hypothetical protein